MRKLLAFSIVLLVFGACTGGVIFLVGTSLGSAPQTMDIPVVNTYPLRATVESGIITSTIAAAGAVIAEPQSAYLLTQIVEFQTKEDKATLSVNHKLGDSLGVGQTLYTYKGKKTVVRYNCRIVDIAVDETTAQFVLLNYDALYLTVSVTLKQVALLSVGEPVSLTAVFDGSEHTFPGTIINFGYEVADGKVDVLIRPSARLLPGTPVKATLTVTRTTESMYTLKQMLLQDGGSYYVQIERADGSRLRKDVEIGEFFEGYIDGNPIEYVEIVDGLDVGDTLVVDVVG